MYDSVIPFVLTTAGYRLYQMGWSTEYADSGGSQTFAAVGAK